MLRDFTNVRSISDRINATIHMDALPCQKIICTRLHA